MAHIVRYHLLDSLNDKTRKQVSRISYQKTGETASLQTSDEENPPILVLMTLYLTRLLVILEIITWIISQLTDHSTSWLGEISCYQSSELTLISQFA